MTFITDHWQAITAVGIPVIGIALMWGFTMARNKIPWWKKNEGIFIKAVRWTEKAIPDDVQNKWASKLDFALKMVLDAYEKSTGTKATEAQKIEFEGIISAVHADLEKNGVL